MSKAKDIYNKDIPTDKKLNLMLAHEKVVSDWIDNQYKLTMDGNLEDSADLTVDDIYKKYREILDYIVELGEEQG
jgi:hypothetical protein